MKGIQLTDADPWQVGSTRDVEKFLRAFALIATDDAPAFAYFESTGEEHVADYLRRVSVEPSAHVKTGTIWPRPDCYHVPLTAETMEAMASFLDSNPAGLFCVHILAYRQGAVVFEWYDAFDAPIFLSRTIAEPTVAAFASAIGSTYSIGW